MDEKEKNMNPEFSLEDILLEFGEPRSEQPEPEEDILIWNGKMPEKSKREPAVPSDTLRLDEITRAIRQQMEEPTLEQTQRFAPVAEETLRFTPVLEETEPVEEDLGQTQRFDIPESEPVDAGPDVLIPEEPRAEPYSESWEPEYEQPMGEYVIPEPIVFRPKSRLRELKRKLVAGPEKRYYDLSELGLGRLQAAMFANLLVVLLAAGTTALYALGVIGTERAKFVIFCQFLSLLLSALLGSYQLLEGFADMLKKRFSMNSLLLFALLACLFDGVLCLQQVRIPCSAAFSLCMTMSLWNAYHRRATEMGQMDTMRKAIRLDSLVSRPDYYEGRPGFLRGEGQVEDFMDSYRTRSGQEKALSVYALTALLVSIALGVTAGVLHGLALGVQAASAAMLVAMPATVFITLSRPMAILEQRFHRLGVVLCGWDGVRDLSETAVFPLSEEDLFPAGSAKMNGVKFYGTRTPDEIVAYAAATVCACGGTMAPLFRQLLDARNGHHLEPRELRYYSGGVGAVVEDDAVLAGTLQFMQSMGVEMPEGTRVNQAVYVAINGELAGVFAVNFSKVKSSVSGMSTLCSYRRLRPVLVSRDFLLTESFLRSRLGCNPRRVAFPDPEARLELAQKQPEEGAPALALITGEGLAPAAYAVTGARALRSASTAGLVVHLLGGILGLVMLVVLAVLNAGYLLTPVNVLLYGLIWTIPGLLITEWTRSI